MDGFERLPSLSFQELMTLVESSYWIKPKKRRLVLSHSYERDTINEFNTLQDDNKIGAIAVIMEDHIEEFIDYLAEKIETDYFSDEQIRDNYYLFSLNGSPYGGIGTRSYLEVLEQYPKWKEISAKVIEQLYPE